MTLPYELAGPARLLRPSDGWRPVGPVLPPVEDDDLHAPLPASGVVWWHLPVELDAQPGDVLVVQERTLELLDRCGPRHHAVRRLRGHLLAHYDPEWAEEWLARRQVWSARIVTVCRDCRAVMARTGRRGRPPVRCVSCQRAHQRAQWRDAKRARRAARTGG